MDAMLSAADIPASLTPHERLSLAQKAYHDYRPECFWFMSKDFAVSESTLPLVIEGLKLSGGHRGWKLAAALCR